MSTYTSTHLCLCSMCISDANAVRVSVGVPVCVGVWVGAWLTAGPLQLPSLNTGDDPAGINNNPVDEGASLVKLVFGALALALRDSHANQARMVHEHNYDLLRDTLGSANLLHGPLAEYTIACVYNMACDTFGRDLQWNGRDDPTPCIVNPNVLKAVVPLLPAVSTSILSFFIDRLKFLCRYEASAQNCCKVSLLEDIIDHLGHVILDVHHQYHPTLMDVVQCLGGTDLSAVELRLLLRLGLDDRMADDATGSKALVSRLARRHTSRKAPRGTWWHGLVLAWERMVWSSPTVVVYCVAV